MADTESPTDQSPATAELLDPGDYSQFLLRSGTEILFVLRSLLGSGANITVYFNEGRHFLLTTLLAVDDGTIVLDYGSSEDMNRRALDADKLFCATQQENVRIQFILRGLTKIKHEGRPAFRADFPDTLLRLQRREYYRLTVPLLRPLRCIVPRTMPDGSREQVEIKVVDISGGGVAIMSPPDNMGFDADAEFPDCRLELPEVGFVVATLKVCTVFEVTLRNGSTIKRAGCKFLNLPGPMMNQVQRYIIKVERERKARETGLV